MTPIERAITAIDRVEQAIDRRSPEPEVHDGAAIVGLAVVALAKTLLAIHGGDR